MIRLRIYAPKPRPALYIIDISDTITCIKTSKQYAKKRGGLLRRPSPVCVHTYAVRANDRTQQCRAAAFHGEVVRDVVCVAIAIPSKFKF